MDSDLMKRQTNINDWYYKYRLETLFIMQLLFIGLAGLIILSILSSYMIVPRIFVMYYGVLMITAICLITYYKYSFNMKSRDFYHWDKLRFPADSTTESPYNSNVKAAITQGITAQC
jgi:fatty-acid desaturase